MAIWMIGGILAISLVMFIGGVWMSIRQAHRTERRHLSLIGFF